MEIKLPEHCNQCPNACPREGLRCGRGRAYFERLQRGETPHESAHPLVELLCRCGQGAEHKSRMMQSRGIDESEIVRCLTEEEQLQLQTLLQTLQQRWDEEHARRHGGNRRPEK